MKLSAILVIAALAGLAGFLFGTEKGRQCKTDLMAKARKTADSAQDAASDAADTVSDTVEGAVEHLAS